MATCKDCIHWKACKALQHTWEKIEGTHYPLIAEKCKIFKDRSKFVDISELQQNVIRPLTNRCAEYTKCQMCLACVGEIREYCAHYKKIKQALKEREKE